MEQEETKTTPRIYVASLSDYNAGRLHGEWIDADQDAEAIRAAISAMLARSKEPFAEEWAIHDYEGFGGLSISEYESIDGIAEVAALLAEHGGMFGALVDHFGGLENMDDAKKCIEEGYQMKVDKLEHYAEAFMAESYHETLASLPDIVRYHIDYAGIARDMELSGDIFTIEYERELHVFWSNF